MNLVKFKRAETVEIYAEVKTQSGVLTDPTAIVLDLYDSAGTQKVTAQAMTKLDTGKYQYFYTLASDAALGFWKGTVTETDGVGASAKVTKTDDGFEVEA
jgi:hypothetical protein